MAPVLARTNSANEISLYIRQDPFTETVYVSRLDILAALAQVAGLILLLWSIGVILTHFWTTRLYSAELIKKLYTVKHTSAGRLGSHGTKGNKKNQIATEKDGVSETNIKIPKEGSTEITALWNKLENLRLSRMRDNIASWA